MKNWIVFLLALGLSLSATAQNDKDFLKLIEGAYVPVVSDSMLVSRCECTNAEYWTYLRSLKRSGGVAYTAAIPDSTGWNFKRFMKFDEAATKAYVEYYQWHPGYRTYPAVNISYDQAVAYCGWLTEKYNATPGRRYKKVLIRLPSKSEWERAAFAIIGKPLSPRLLPWDGYSFVDSKGHYRANFQPVEDYQIRRNEQHELYLSVPLTDHNSYQDGALFTSACPDVRKKDTEAYAPNDFGLYHMAGNVSEMLIEKGRTKGGSFISPGYYLLVKTDDDEFPNQELGGPFIGFRPFLFVIEK